MFTFEMFNLHTSCDERKPYFGICKNKDAYQAQSFLSLNPKFPASTIFCGHTAQFVSDLVETSEDMFSHVTTLKSNSVTIVTDGVLVFFLGECLQEKWSLVFISNLSHNKRKLSIWFPTRSDTNQAVQSRTRARGLKFGI